jgi:DNA-directed RNA polymerase specialized sigma24 family protein
MPGNLERLHEVIDAFNRAAKLLPQRRGEFLAERMGGCTYREIGEAHGVSSSRARQIVRRAVRDLTHRDRLVHFVGVL